MTKGLRGDLSGRGRIVRSSEPPYKQKKTWQRDCPCCQAFRALLRRPAGRKREVLERNCLIRALVHANTALQAIVGVHRGHAVNQRDGLSWACIHACAASYAILCFHCCCHCSSFIVLRSCQRTTEAHPLRVIRLPLAQIVPQTCPSWWLLAETLSPCADNPCDRQTCS